jgi:hypothetical protein
VALPGPRSGSCDPSWLGLLVLVVGPLVHCARGKGVGCPVCPVDAAEHCFITSQHVNSL